MSQDIAEKDWKIFRSLHDIALERFCERVLAEVGALVSDSGKSSHERYSAIIKLMRRRDKELANAFDDPRRSVALQQLMCIQSHKLLTAEEFASFSPETRDKLERWLTL